MRLKQALLGGMLGIVALFSSGCLFGGLTGGALSDSERNSQRMNVQIELSACLQNSDGVHNCETLEATLRLLTEVVQPLTKLWDPLILELPAGASNIAGTFADQNDAANNGDLIIYRGLHFIPVDDNRTLRAGPDKQLVIVDLPDSAQVDGAQYALSLNWEEPPGGPPAPFKALLTGKVTLNDKTFYVPLFPCTSNLDNIPTLTLPISNTLVPIFLPNGITGCNEERYRYSSHEFAPPLSCDLDNDLDVDRNDLAEIMAFRNQATDPGDPRDINGDGLVNANDARACVVQCTLPRCAVTGPVL